MKFYLPIRTLLALSVGLASLHAQTEPELVNIQAIDPTIKVELRYATDRNTMKRAIYPPNMPALIRPSVAAKLVVAQEYLKTRGFRLKIWDAYRPKSAHEQLWKFMPNADFVASPTDGGSLHTWGVAVDATLVYANGQAVSMPTDFDEFTPEALLHYTGGSGSVREHLFTLQRAMARAGFYGMRTEWWHFVDKEWKNFRAVEEEKNSAERKPAGPAPAKAQEVRSSSRLPSANIPAGRGSTATR